MIRPQSAVGELDIFSFFQSTISFTFPSSWIRKRSLGSTGKDNFIHIWPSLNHGSLIALPYWGGRHHHHDNSYLAGNLRPGSWPQLMTEMKRDQTNIKPLDLYLSVDRWNEKSLLYLPDKSSFNIKGSLCGTNNMPGMKSIFSVSKTDPFLYNGLQ